VEFFCFLHGVYHGYGSFLSVVRLLSFVLRVFWTLEFCVVFSWFFFLSSRFLWQEVLLEASGGEFCVSFCLAGGAFSA
jgi:hypothetical protein